MSLLFISSIVPDTEYYHNAAFTRSGQNVMKGIADALCEEQDVELVSCRPLPSFPNGPLWVKSSTDTTDKGQLIHFLPTLNLLFVKNIVWGIYAYIYMLKWARKHKDERRDVLVYNIYVPIISALYRAAKNTQSKLYAILYDLGVPPAHLNLGRLKMFGYSQFEKLAYKYIPLLDGRIVINEKIIDEYAPGKDSILIDGGINEDVVNKLFPLAKTDGETITYVLAGMLWEQNGTRLILETLKNRPDLDVRVIFAGKGNAVDEILEAARYDSRIEYVGMLNMGELFKVYEKSDVLLNLRIEEENDMHFPSKLLEYMSVGKWVISTPVAHAERDYGEFLDFLYEMTPDALALKMESIAGMPKELLLDRGLKTRAFMLENRTWHKRTQEIIEYINGKKK